MTGHFGTTDPPVDLDTNTFRTHPHRRRDTLLDGAPKSHSLLDLTRQVVGHQLRIEFRLLHFLDVECHILLGQRLQFVAQLVDLGAAATDGDARTRRMHLARHPLRMALDVDARYTGTLQALADVPPEGDVLSEEPREIFLGEPV